MEPGPKECLAKGVSDVLQLNFLKLLTNDSRMIQMIISLHISTILICNVPISITQCHFLDSMPNTIHHLQVPQTMH